MHNVVIIPAGLGKRGQQYSVTYLGSLLVESTRNPEFDACRALRARGITGEWCRSGDAEGRAGSEPPSRGYIRHGGTERRTVSRAGRNVARRGKVTP